jgi:hypothetical protein
VHEGNIGSVPEKRTLPASRWLPRLSDKDSVLGKAWTQDDPDKYIIADLLIDCSEPVHRPTGNYWSSIDERLTDGLATVVWRQPYRDVP